MRNQLAKALAAQDKELQIVGDIQRSLLPDALPSIPGFELATYYQTSARPAATITISSRSMARDGDSLLLTSPATALPLRCLWRSPMRLPTPGPAHTPPAALLAYLNDMLTCAYTRGGTFVTAFYLVLDPATRTLVYSRAGHNPPRLVRGDHILPLDGAGGLPLGIQDGQVYDQFSVKLERGDMLVLYTDGITEAMSPPQKDKHRRLFETERLDKLLLASGGSSAEKCITQIRTEVDAFTENAPPTDDQTLIAIRCL